MPEMMFAVRWPDSSVTQFYSPSLVIQDYLAPGEEVALPEFLDRARTALTIASDRVKAKYGFSCSRAAASLASIEHLAAKFPAPDARVTITEFSS
jgi:uncharacterized repeat protein (TIGR04042 family)